jgi:hypothetical protein
MCLNRQPQERERTTPRTQEAKRAEAERKAEVGLDRNWLRPCGKSVMKDWGANGKRCTSQEKATQVPWGSKRGPKSSKGRARIAQAQQERWHAYGESKKALNITPPKRRGQNQ